MIEPVQIATNRCAAGAAQAINMYSMDQGEALTLGQLMAAVCIKAGAGMEAQSIARMNRMNVKTVELDTASDYLARLAQDNIADDEWAVIKEYLINTLGIEESALPADAKSYNNRMQAIKAMKVKLEALTRTSQEDMIEMQSLINFRDVAFTTATNLISSLGATKNATADNL